MVCLGFEPWAAGFKGVAAAPNIYMSTFEAVQMNPDKFNH